MNWQRVWTVVQKEWEETIRNKTIVFTFLGMALLFTVLPLGIAFILPAFGAQEIANDPDMESLLELLSQAYPAFVDLDLVSQFQVYLLRQFIILLLLLPIMGAMSIATYSIIGEKTTRSLEALLATPVRTDELLLGKSLAAAIPSVIVTWIAFLVLATATRVLGGPEVFRFALDSAAWGIMFLIAPLAALLALGIGVIVSSRSSDPRSAQQVGALLVLPLIAIFIAQTAGFFLLGLPLVILGAIILLLIDVAVLYLGVSLFNREAILTRWR